MTAGHSKRKERAESIAHYLTALVVFLKGLDKLDQGKTGLGIFFMAIAAFIVFGTLYHHKAEKLLRHFKAYVYGLEAIIMAIVGYLYMTEGKYYIQYVCFASSLIFVIAMIIAIKKFKPANL